ncbi:MAG: hypothetical protein OEZ34_03500 [Spirochaetia bacterium]|nr:hypothetical protein [Spirochaetia bacterium]
MAKKTDILEEMKGQARVFRVDRDAIIIYTGRDKSDIQPFIRVGAGDNIPHGLLKHIENVIIPESDLWNMGLEMAWQDASLKQGVDHIQYVGNKDMVNQVYLYTRFSEKDDEYHKKTVKLLPYKKTKLTDTKEKSYINFFSNGNMNIQVHGSKVVDFENFIRSKINLDKEYDLMNKSQRKMKLRGKEGVGFVFFGTEDGLTPSMLWNLDGNGAFLNPTHEYPYTLFENMLDVDNLFMATTSNPYNSGFIEAIRRKNISGDPISAYCPFPDQALPLKKLYKNTQVQFIDDAKVLPGHKNTTYYVSKSGSHGLFSIKLAEKAEEPVKILFPLGLGRKITKTFDYAKGPYDLEFASVNSSADINGSSLSHMQIHFQGNMKPQSYLNLKLDDNSFPVIQGAEYKMHYTENHNSIAEMYLSSFKGTGFEENIPALYRYVISGNQDDKALRDILISLRKTKVPQSVYHRVNLHEFFRFLKNQPAFSVSMKPIFQKTIDRIQSRFGFRKIKVKDLVMLEGLYTEVDIVFDGGLGTYVLCREVERNDPFQFQFPPDSQAFDLLQGEYKSLLKQQNRVLDKMDIEAPGFRPALEMMEKIFEDRKGMVEERARLGELLEHLGMSFDPEVEKRTFLSYLPNPLQKFFRSLDPVALKDRVYTKIEPVVENFRNFRAAFFLLPFFLIFAAGAFFFMQTDMNFLKMDGTSEHTAVELENEANRVPEGEAVTEAQPGNTETALNQPVDEGAQNQPVENAAVSEEEGGFFSTIASWFSSEDKTSNILSANGDTPEEIAAVSVLPGEIQEDVYVPGEDAIQNDPVETMQYANALAIRNGFTPIHNPPEARLRDPDMVFPGDRLKLPDGRLLRIIKGETIWMVSKRHYKKDFARILILEKQIVSSDDAKKKIYLLKSVNS